MEKISINLLPYEFTAALQRRKTFLKIQAVGYSIVLLTVFLSVLLVTLRILQSSQLNATSARAKEAEGKVSSFSGRQASLVLLKDRLQAAEQHVGISSKQAEMYNLISSLLPRELTVTQISIGEGEVLVTAYTSDVNVLDKTLSVLLDKEKNEGKVTKVSIDSLNRGRDGVFRSILKVLAK